MKKKAYSTNEILHFLFKLILLLIGLMLLTGVVSAGGGALSSAVDAIAEATKCMGIGGGATLSEKADCLLKAVSAIFF